MKSERERVARQARAEGAEASARIRADADRERTVLLADARARADELRGQGEAQAIAIYADAFQRDAHFFGVWRTLQAYREAFANGASRLVLSPGDDFLQMLHHAPRPEAARLRPAPRPPRRPGRTPRREHPAAPAALAAGGGGPHTSSTTRRDQLGALSMRYPTRLAMRAGAVLLAAALIMPATPVLAQARAAPESFADLAAKLLPGVVNISSSQTVQSRNDRARAGDSDLPARLAVRAVLPRFP